MGLVQAVANRRSHSRVETLADAVDGAAHRDAAGRAS